MIDYLMMYLAVFVLWAEFKSVGHSRGIETMSSEDCVGVLSLFYGGVRDASFSMVECNSSRSDCRLPISVPRSHLSAANGSRR